MGVWNHSLEEIVCGREFFRLCAVNYIPFIIIGHLLKLLTYPVSEFFFILADVLVVG